MSKKMFIIFFSACPNCSILINREEGCNQVSCAYCDFKFCWNCLGVFDEGKCGFYKCVMDTSKADASEKDGLTTEGRSKRSLEGATNSPSQKIKTSYFESGVPNVYQIEKSLQQHHQ